MNVNTEILVATVVFAAAACAGSSGRVVGERPSASLQARTHYVILPDSAVTSVLGTPVACGLYAEDRSTDIPSASWTPEQDLVRSLDAIVDSLLEAIKVREPGVALPQAYSRQYFGFVVNDTRIIQVIGISKSYTHPSAENQRELVAFVASEWHRTPIYVCDSGTDQFAIRFSADGSVVSPLKFFLPF